jgi:hypothetical protein
VDELTLRKYAAYGDEIDRTYEKKLYSFLERPEYVQFPKPLMRCSDEKKLDQERSRGA